MVEPTIREQAKILANYIRAATKANPEMLELALADLLLDSTLKDKNWNRSNDIAIDTYIQTHPETAKFREPNHPTPKQTPKKQPPYNSYLR